MSSPAAPDQPDLSALTITPSPPQRIKRSAPDSSPLYTPAWECPVCLSSLGKDEGVVPMASMSCDRVAHIVCYTCVQSMSANANALVCPLCNEKTAGFVPLRALVNENADVLAGQLLSNHFIVKRSRKEPASPVAPAVVAQPSWRVSLASLMNPSCYGVFAAQNIVGAAGIGGGSTACVVHNANFRHPLQLPSWRAPQGLEKRAAYVAIHAIAAFDAYGAHYGYFKNVPAWDFQIVSKRPGVTMTQIAAEGDEAFLSRISEELQARISALCRPLGIHIKMLPCLRMHPVYMRYRIRSLPREAQAK